MIEKHTLEWVIDFHKRLRNRSRRLIRNNYNRSVRNKKYIHTKELEEMRQLIEDFDLLEYQQVRYYKRLSDGKVVGPYSSYRVMELSTKHIRRTNGR